MVLLYISGLQPGRYRPPVGVGKSSVGGQIEMGIGWALAWSGGPENKAGIPKLNREDGNSE